jgi:hypothetical protein
MIMWSAARIKEVLLNDADVSFMATGGHQAPPE